MPRRESLSRLSCVLLVLLGLGLSLVEEARCRDAGAGPAAELAQIAGPDVGTELPPGAPAQSEGRCCPCVHLYPTASIVAAGPVATVVGHSTTPAARPHPLRDRHPQPLVPPPIA
jgi:hypothetical protein